MRQLIAAGLLLLSWGAHAQEPAEGNLFHEPFLQLSHKIDRCKEPRGPWVTAADVKADTHWRTNSGVSCYLAGKCRLMNSYQYDDGIAERVKATFERDGRFEESSVWAHVQRRLVTLMGCVKDESQKAALIAAMQGIDDVNQVIDQLGVGAEAAPRYTVKK